ncbi:MAG TPA: adenosylcobinamide-GDP ribazoletransferase [Thermomicrobiales bacterium]|jgi:adenosylcobinamide-GDP ribazoletransferase
MLIALGFLTALPVPRRTVTPTTLGRSLIFFPFVGLLVGFLLYGLDLVLAWVLPDGVRAACLLMVLIALTRGLHLDGLMDCCDGLFGGFTPERRLEIMRDSRVGAFGVLGAVVFLVMRYSGIAALDGGWRLVGLVLPPLLGRWAMAAAIVAYPYGRTEGMGADFKRAATPWQAGLATMAAAALGVTLWWPWGAVALLPAALVLILAARFILGRVGGMTGDCYGAINELVEVSLLLIVVGAQTMTRGG